MKLKYILILLALPLYNIIGQNIPVGTWRNHTDYSNGKKLAEFNAKVFCSVNNGLFYLNTEDGSINTLSTTSGLNSIEITAMKTIAEEELLLLGYKDGTIDLINNTLEIQTLPTIRNSNITGSKQINAAIYQSDITFLATDFGVVLLNTRELQLIDSYSNLSAQGTALPINHITSDGDNLYLSTSEGLLTGSLNPQINLKDFQNWQRLPLTEDQDITLKKTVLFGNQIFALGANNIIYKKYPQAWDTVFQSEQIIHNIKTEANQLWVLAGSSSYTWENDRFTKVFTYQQSKGIKDLVSSATSIYLADSSLSLVQYQQNNFQPIQPQGPKGHPETLRQLEGYTISMNKEAPGFSYFFEGRWGDEDKDINETLLPHFTDVELDLISGNGVFLSEAEGFFSWDTEKIAPLESKQAKSGYQWTALATDPQANIWALGRDTAAAIILYQLTNATEFSLALNPAITINDFEIAFNGDKYLATNNGLYVYNEISGQSRLLNSAAGNGNLPGNVINDLSFDLSGNLWIATNRGAAFLNSFEAVLSGESVDAIQPIIDGFFLFDNINVNRITTDGGNRKWMTTSDGLWLFDEDINANLMHLRADNSPLVEEDIRQLVINPINGEVFLATENQFLSYRTDASRAGTTHSNVEIFPNPVELSRHQRVTVRGLAYNNEVMITDVAGNLIHKGRANGGTFSWNLVNYSGFRAKRGIYLLFSINNDGTETYQSKFAVVY